VLQGLVKWTGMREALATWEDLEALRRRFPLAATWGQVASQEGGNVSNTDMGIDCTSDPRPKRTTKPNKNVVGPDWSKWAEPLTCAALRTFNMA
jgi:hypothetical protein